MLHICQIIPGLPFGGAERFVVDLINHADPSKFKFSLIVFGSNNPLAEEIIAPNVDIYIIPKKGKISWGLFGVIKKKLLAIKPDIVHTHLFGADVWGRVAARRAGIPVITTEHNFNYGEGWIKKIVKRSLRNYSSCYTVFSEAVANYLSQTYQINKPIKLIPMGIELNRFVRLSPPDFNSTYQLLILGRLTKQKGHAIALTALAQLKNYPWRLRVVGNGELLSELKKLTIDLALSERVEFVPATHQVPEELAKADLLLVPSLWEGLGIVAMEGLAAGRLVVVAKTGGLPEIITDAQTGYLVLANNPTVLAERLAWCFDHPAECQTIALAGKNYAINNFGIEKRIKEFEKLYTEVIKK